MPINPLTPLTDLLPKQTLGTSGQDIIKGVQEQQLLQAQAAQATQAAQANQAQAIQHLAKAQDDHLAVQRKQAFQAALATAGRNPTYEMYSQIAAQFPEFSEGMKVYLTSATEDEKNRFVVNALPAFNALARGRTDLGISWLDRAARAHDARGQKDKAEEFRTLIDAVHQLGPYAANGALGGKIQAIMGKEGFDSAVSAMNLEQTQREQIAKTKSAEAKAQAEADVKGGLLAQGRQTVATGAAQEQQARAMGAKTAEETTQLQAARDANLVFAEQRAAKERSEAEKLANEAAVSPMVQFALARKGVAEADDAVARAALGPKREAALLQKQEADAALAKLTVANAPIENELKNDLLKTQSKEGLARIADLTQKQDMAEKEYQLKKTEEDNKWRTKMMEIHAKDYALGDEDKKRIAGLVTDAAAARQRVTTAEDLLMRVDRDTTVGRAGGWPVEKIKSMLSLQGAETMLRIDLARFFTKDMLTQVPPGALSNQEQDIIREGLPKVFDNPDVIRRYLTAATGIAKAEAEIKDGWADWQSMNGGSAGPARYSFRVMGIIVKPGEKFEDAKKKYGRAKQLEREAAELKAKLEAK